MRPLAVTAVALSLAASAAPAAAEPSPLPPPAHALPVDGASLPASSWPAASPFETVDFTLYVYAPALRAGPFDIEVASGPDADADGTLADGARVDRLSARPRPGFPGVLSVRTGVDAQWVGTPGTYWWRAYAEAGGTVYASPLQRLVIRPRTQADDVRGDAPAGSGPAAMGPAGGAAPSYAAAARLTRATARQVVRATVRQRTRVRPRRLRARCAFPTPYDARCRVAWRDLSFRYRGTMFVWAGTDGTGASFSGTRTVRGCRRDCATPLRWAP